MLYIILRGKKQTVYFVTHICLFAILVQQVLIFFLFLSGFGLFYSFCKCKSIKEFYKKRFLRIVPIYLIIAIPWYFYVDVINNNKDWLLYIGDISTLSFLYHGDRGHWYIFGILVLYLLYPLLLKSIIINKKLSILCFLLVYTIIMGILATFNLSFFDRINVFLMRVPSFYIGVFLGVSEDNRSISSTKLFASMAIMFLVSTIIEGLLCIKGLHYSALARIFYTPLAISICFFCAWFNNENIINSFITWIGGFSLEMYLIHMKCTSLLTAFLV